MSSFHQVLIGGYPAGGLMTDQKPLMLPDEAFSKLENSYVFRNRTKKREGTVGMGRLTRVFSGISAGPSIVNPQVFNLYTIAGVTPEPNAEIAAGSVVVVIGPSSYQDQGNGTFLPTAGVGNGTINYLTGAVSINTGEGLGNPRTVSFGYYPSLPVMGIWKRDVSSVGVDQTIFFDTVYAYQYILGGFEEVAPGTIWTGPNNANGTNTYFFWSCNFQGSTPDLKYFFTTNNNITATTFDPIRYLSNTGAWSNLTPLITATDTLYQALILVPYYGRLLALNTWEGTTAGTYTAAKNFYARCRFAQIGDPIDLTNSWRSDIFGRGGFLDAPTNESIVSVAFYRNTLIVFFEYSTWQLRYIGEYGLPFIFERISSDFGATSTFSPVIFDNGVMAIGGRGIIQAGASGVNRIDQQIPETAFGFQIQNNSPSFVHGVRDYEKELVFWNYFDDTSEGQTQVWPNTTLVYNYKNNTWAQFRDTITCFGTGQFQFGITWDSLSTRWDSEVSWDNVDDQQYVDYTIAGNQQGFIFIYENPDAAVPNAFPSQTMFAPSLAITAFNFGVSPTQITVPNHNLMNNEIIYLQNTIWTGTTPAINNQIYQVKVIDSNIITLQLWNQVDMSYGDVVISTSTYVGGGLISLLPRMNIQGKDFNPFQGKGLQFKLSSIDFQMDSNQASPGIPAVSIQLFVNSYLGEQANMLVGLSNQELLNNSQNVGFINDIQLTNPCIVESQNHSISSGDIIYIANILGTTQLNQALYTITVVDANNFSLNGIDATGYTPYISNGVWNTTPVDGQTYIPGSQYAWYSFYSNQFGQYIRVGITYDDTLMNQLSTHQLPMELNAMMFYFRPGGSMTN